MNFDDFIAKYDGRFVDFDGAYGAQCVDLMNRYLVDVLGITSPIQTLPGGTAFEIYQNFKGSAQFQKTDNTPDGVPQKGDIVFWNTTVGSAGHVDLFIEGTQNSFVGFDQNWPLNSACHRQVHDYTGVAGWLHPTVSVTDKILVDSQTFKKLVHNSGVSDQVNDYFGLPHDSDFAPIKVKLDQMEQDRESAQNEAHNQTSALLALQSIEASDKATIAQLNKQIADNPPQSAADTKLMAIYRVVYDKWSILPLPSKWYWVVQLHKIKYIFEKT